MRVDALRNRARLLEAAEEVFAAKGVAASTEEIARVAGVGIGTLFRHFPAKEDLLRAVFVARLDRLVAEAEALSVAQRPGEALFVFFRSAVAQSANKKALADALSQAGVEVDTAAAAPATALWRALDDLLKQAKQEGTVRSDVQVTDLIGLLYGASMAMEKVAPNMAAQERIISVFVAGLRSHG